VSEETPASDMQRARMPLDERTKARALSWPPYRRCRIHWSPSEAKAHPLEVVTRLSIRVSILDLVQTSAYLIARPFPACSRAEAAAPRVDQASDGNPRLDGIEQKHPDQFVRDRSGLVKGVKLSVNDL
jgi:hypothetical protein